MKEIYTRRSIRKYDLTRTVSDELIEKVIKAGFQAPSARRQEPAYFVVIDDQSIINELSTISKGSMILSEVNRVVCLMGANPNNISNPRMESQDLSACMENMLLEARHLGLGTCWIGVYPLEERMNGVREVLNMPGDYFPFALMAIGYPRDEKDFVNLERFYPGRIFKNRF